VAKNEVSCLRGNFENYRGSAYIRLKKAANVQIALSWNQRYLPSEINVPSSRTGKNAIMGIINTVPQPKRHCL